MMPEVVAPVAEVLRTVEAFNADGLTVMEALEETAATFGVESW